jgi:F-type H+-transporting ATPase subunit a
MDEMHAVDPSNAWSLGKFLIGTHHPLLMINKDTIIHTWFVLVILFLVLGAVRFALMKKKSVVRFLAMSYIEFFKDLCNQSMSSFSFTHFAFITSLFTFIFVCNTISILPTLEEPTTDINTTLALGIITFFYIQVVTIYTHGIVTYLKEYFTPFFIMFPLHVIGKLASVVSLSFRLFGNILGGALISNIWLQYIKGSLIMELCGLLTGFNIGLFLFFGLFEGFLQAFVFTMLSLTYLSIALHGEET